MQTKLKIKTTNAKYIYGKLDGEESNKSLVIFVHGFTGSGNEAQFFKAVDFFNGKNISTFRFNLYGRPDDSRKSSEVSFEDHITDTNQIIDHFKDKFENMFLVGHSLGGPVISLSDNAKVSGMVLWDPSNGFDSPESKKIFYNKHLDAYICDYRIQSIFSKKLIEQWMQVTFEKQIQSMKVPTKVVFAGEYDKYDQWRDYLDRKPINGNFEIIQGASHNFVEPGVSKKLYEATYSFVEKFL